MTSTLSPYRSAPLCPAHAAEIDRPTCPRCARLWSHEHPRPARDLPLLYDRGLRRTFVAGLFAATVFGAVIGTGIGFVAGMAPMWAVPPGTRMAQRSGRPRPPPPAREVAVPVTALDPPSVISPTRPDAEPATAPVAALTPLLAAIGPKTADAEALLERVQALARAGVPIPIELRRLPPDTEERLSPELASSVRIVPRQDNGRVVGIQVFGVRPHGLAARAGLRSGDVILALNGLSLADLSPPLEALSFGRRAALLELARRGEPRVILLRW